MSDLQAIADDLGAVEEMLYALWRSLPPRQEEIVVRWPPPRIEPLAPPRKLGPKRPDVPRCSQKTKSGEPCRESASHPHGLCATHFKVLFGHEVRMHWPNFTEVCKNCFKSWSMGGSKGRSLEYCAAKTASVVSPDFELH